MNKKIIVTGGTGYIGSHTIVDLLQNGYEVVSIDNLSRSRAKVLDGIKQITGIEVQNYAIDLCDLEAAKSVFEEHKNITGIIHFAAYKSVPESVEFPLRYYDNNLKSLLNILLCMEEFNIKELVFSSSCSVYGNVATLPVTEATPLSKPECAYAATKQMGEQILDDFIIHGKQHQAISLRYFNPVGAHESALIGELPIGKPNNLVPVITQTAVGILDKMYVWGSNYDTRDGSCIRDYIHVMDIAHAHTLAIQALHTNSASMAPYEIINLGSGNGVSVLEAIYMFEKISGLNLKYELAERRQGDVQAIYANNEKAKSMLQWAPKYTLEDMMRTAWNWQLALGKL